MIQILRLRSMCLNGDCVLHYKYKKTTATPTRDCSLRFLSPIQRRHRTPSSPIGLSEVIHKPFALSRVFPLSSGGKSAVLVKKKAPSRSGFSLSMYVVLKTRHINPNIHARRYQSHVRSPNLSTTRPQLFIPTRSNNLIEVTSQSYIASHRKLYGISPKLYSFLRHPIQLYPHTHIPKVLRQGAGWEIFVREAQEDKAGVCVFAKVLVILRTDQSVCSTLPTIESITTKQISKTL